MEKWIQKRRAATLRRARAYDEDYRQRQIDVASKAWDHDDNGWETTHDLSFNSDRPYLDHYSSFQIGLVLVTNESWGGTYDGGLLQLEIRDDFTVEGLVFIAIHGNDDTSMYLRGITRDKADAVIRRIPVPVTMCALKSMGFDYD